MSVLVLLVLAVAAAVLWRVLGEVDDETDGAHLRHRRTAVAVALAVSGVALVAPRGPMTALLVTAVAAVAWIVALELATRRLESTLEGWGLVLGVASLAAYGLAFEVPAAARWLVVALFVALTGRGLVAATRGRRRELSDDTVAATGRRRASLLVPVVLALPTIHLWVGWSGLADAATRPARDAVVGVHLVMAVLLAMAGHRVRESSRRRAEGRLRESEDRYRLLVDASADAVLVAQGDAVVFANPAARRLFALDVAGDGSLGALRDLGLPPLRVTAELPLEHRHVADGEGRHLELSCREIPYREATAWQVVARDVTTFRRLEAESERMAHLAALGELGASIAHEIRNPLGALVFNLRYLVRGRDDDATVAAEMAAVEADVERIQEVIAGVLELARGDDLDATGAGVPPPRSGPAGPV